MLLLSFPAIPAQKKFLAVISHDTAIYLNFLNSLEVSLGENSLLDKTDIAGLDSKNLAEYELVISIGTDASEILSRTGEINRLVSTLIPRGLSDAINKRPCLTKQCSTILIEQPVRRYFQLFKNIFSKENTLVIATTSPGIYETQNLKAIANKYNIDLKIITVNKDKGIARSLITKLEKNDVLLALPDPVIYNKNTAKSIILSAYHKNVPIIAYSKAFAKAGALISLYSSFSDIANMTTRLSGNPRISNKNEFYTNEFSIEFNHAVAKSLNITIDDIEELKRKIK